MADAFENAIVRLLSRIGPGESISPAEAAREASQETGVEWEQLLKAVRRAAVKLALEGRAVILLKGEAVDPEHFRGIYRIGGGDYFTPRKAPPAYTPPPQPLAPKRDYRPEPRPYTKQPEAPAAPARAAAPPAAAPVRLEVRLSPPAPTPPLPVPPAAAALPPPPVAIAPLPPASEPVPHPRIGPRPPAFEDAAEAPAEARPGWTIDEGTPVTRYELDSPDLGEDEPGEDERDFLDEVRRGVEKPPPAPALSFEDDDDYDEDAHRAPHSATLDDIASQLERYLAAQLDDPARGNAEIGNDVVRLPRQQDE
jgi:Protein of unknown function (DUF3253)